MRALLVLMLLIGGTAQAEDVVEWWTEDGDKTLIYGVRDSHFGGLKASCQTAGFRVFVMFGGEYPGRWREGQTATTSVSAGGREIGRITGVLNDDQTEQQWILEAKIGTDHPLFQRLFSGTPVVIGRRGYPLDPRGGSDALASFRRACLSK